MRYKNTKTGAIVDSPFKVIGVNWELLEDIEAEQEVEQVDEYVEEEVDLEEMTNRELEKFAKENDIELTSEDKKNKDARIAAIVAAFE